MIEDNDLPSRWKADGKDVLLDEDAVSLERGKILGVDETAAIGTDGSREAIWLIKSDWEREAAIGTGRAPVGAEQGGRHGAGGHDIGFDEEGASDNDKNDDGDDGLDARADGAEASREL